MIYLWGFLSGVLVVACEAGFALSPSYWSRAWLFLPAAVLINYLIYLLVRSAPSLPAAFVVFSVMTLGLRTAAAVWLEQPIGPGTWGAIGLLVVAAGLRQVWG